MGTLGLKLRAWLRRAGKAARPAFYTGDRQGTYGTVAGVPTTGLNNRSFGAVPWVANADGQMNQVGATEAKVPAYVDARGEKKPVEVVSELLQPVPVISAVGIKEAQRSVRERRRHLVGLELPHRDEDEALRYLLAREKYPKVQHLFPWQVTTRNAIEALLSKYKLQEVGLTGYVKVVPTEALQEIQRFIAGCKLLDETPPVFTLIIDDGGKETTRDPILLAASPFGRWYYVLGAWDKEIEYVEELIYRGR